MNRGPGVFGLIPLNRVSEGLNLSHDFPNASEFALISTGGNVRYQSNTATLMHEQCVPITTVSDSSILCNTLQAIT